MIKQTRNPKTPTLPEGEMSPSYSCSAGDDNDIWGDGEKPNPRIYVYRSKENAEYVRAIRKSQMPDQEWRQLILHRDDPLPKGLSSVTYLDDPNEGSVESHRLGHQKLELSHLHES